MNFRGRKKRDVTKVDLKIAVDLPTETKLATNSNIEDNKFGFKVNLKIKTQTITKMMSIVSKIFDPFCLAAPFMLQGKCFILKLYKKFFCLYQTSIVLIGRTGFANWCF